MYNIQVWHRAPGRDLRYIYTALTKLPIFQKDKVLSFTHNHTYITFRRTQKRHNLYAAQDCFRSTETGVKGWIEKISVICNFVYRADGYPPPFGPQCRLLTFGAQSSPLLPSPPPLRGDLISGPLPFKSPASAPGSTPMSVGKKKLHVGLHINRKSGCLTGSREPHPLPLLGIRWNPPSKLLQPPL